MVWQRGESEGSILWDQCACARYTTWNPGMPSKAERCFISLNPAILPKDGKAGHSKQVTFHGEKAHEPEVAVSRVLPWQSCSRLDHSSVGLMSAVRSRQRALVTVFLSRVDIFRQRRNLNQ